MTDAVLHRLAATLERRKALISENSSDKSYVTALYAGGNDLILKKVGEEATEVILAAKGNNSGQFDAKHLVMETADLWFHTMVLLAHNGLGPEDVLGELESRFDRSGLDEKAARNIKEE